jgi:ABC-type polysaccharide/polyol phosphate transport system ATPase subunit
VLLRRSRSPKQELWALRDVNVEIIAGQTFGVVGQNGSGKSTLLKLFAGVFEPTEGELAVRGEVGSLLELGAGFHPEFTGVENVYLNAAIHGLGRSYVDEHLVEILEFAELEDFGHVPVKTYSSGMYLRLGFAVATHLRPDILLIDEVLAVGDEAFQEKCYERIWQFRETGGTIVFVSHDPAAVERLCDRAILLERGRVLEEGTPDGVLRAYHRRLAGRSESKLERDARGRAGPCAILETKMVAGDGAIRSHFIEGEPAVIETVLFSETGVSGAEVRISIENEEGRLLASRTAPNVEVRADWPETIRLHLDAIPLREGRFPIDVRVVGFDGSELASQRKALVLSVAPHEEGADGPVRLAGKWELRLQQDRVSDAAES